MKEFIGSKVKFVIDSHGYGPDKPFVAKVVGDGRDLVYVQSTVEGNAKVTRINKSKIAMFEPVDGEPEFIPLQILSCENVGIGCPGVQFVKDGAEFDRRDFESFTASCPLRCETCSFGTKGELRSANGKFVRAMIAGTIYGEFPTKEQIDE